MKLQRLAVPFFLLLLVSASALFAQGMTGNLTGDITQGGASLPGVTVTVSSPNLQGTRTTVTNENGAYNFAALPPGDYNVQFTLEGMKAVTQKVNVSLASTARADADMKVASLSEAITVTASTPAVMETTQVETNFKQATINQLPVARNPVAQANLAPGVTTNGPAGNTVISGAFSYDNLYLVNGAVVNENLRGQPHALYIEDAIQETTILSGAVSAEYGRFTGGVVSSITKSGGNEFDGSVRDSIDNPKWTAQSKPGQATPIDANNNTEEATFGGRIIRDRLWFFAAGRMADSNATPPFTSVSGADQGTFPQTNTRHRVEAKLTGQITQKHSLILSYLNNDVKQTDNCQFGCLDSRTLDPSTHSPNNFKTIHYNGVITNNFLLEGDYAKKYFAFVGFGGDLPRGATSSADLAAATPIEDAVVTGAIFNAPYFCGSCSPETRNNNEWELKGHYFLGTKSLGTHNMVFGYDNWAEQRNSNNFQSPTDFRLDILNTQPVQNADRTVSITVHGNPQTGDRIVYFPIAQTSLGSNLKTASLFLNDKWDFNQHLSFNVGARYDKNDAKDSIGNTVSNDKAISPRLGAIFDVFGNGRLRVDANYSKYVGRLAETVAGQGSAAGNPATIQFRYSGPDIPLEDSRVALAQVFDWFLANGGLNMKQSANPSIPGFNRRLDGTIASPDMREITVGAGTQMGRGYFRADLIDRDWNNFYAQFVNLGIGTVTNPGNGQKADLILVGNSNLPDRKYRAAELQGQYQLGRRFTLGGNYTYSTLKGNVEGETSGGGPVTFAGLSTQFAQYQGFTQNSPVGFLAEDQRHKVRAWVGYDLNTRIGNFNTSLIERFDSGTPYSASSNIPIQFSANFYRVGTNSATCPNPADCSGGITNPGYAAPPTTVGYFFGQRGQFRWDDIKGTDVALNYSLPIRMMTLFAKGEARNVFNQKAVVNGDTTVFTAANAGKGLRAFNPFTDTPVECPQGNTAAQCTALGANWQRGPNFGKPLTATTFSSQGSFTLPRTYLVSFGARF